MAGGLAGGAESLSALVLGLAAATLWGLSGFIGGHAARRTPALFVATGAQAVGLVLIVAALAIWRSAAPSLSALTPAMLGGLAGGVGLVALFRALAVGQMSLVAPIAGTGVAVPIVAGIAGGERPTEFQAVGIALAVIGVLEASRTAAPPFRERQESRTLPVVLAIVAAACFGAFYLGLAAGGEHDVLWTVAAARVLSVAFLVSWSAIYYMRHRVKIRTASFSMASSGVLDVTGNAVFTVATASGLLVLAAVPASLYPIVTVLCARYAFSERLGAHQKLGAGLSLVSIAFMAVPT